VARVGDNFFPLFRGTARSSRSHFETFSSFHARALVRRRLLSLPLVGPCQLGSIFFFKPPLGRQIHRPLFFSGNSLSSLTEKRSVAVIGSSPSG